LVSTLRSHLSRLTFELSSHQALLTELRSLRDADVKALQSKSDEVELLRDRVERLAGEVEVLKGVVEEGLKERRMVREQGMASQDESSVRSDKARDRAEEDQILHPNNDDGQYESSPDDNVSLSRTPPRPQSNIFDKTMRTDYATVGSSLVEGQRIKPFINSEEVERISFELDERRSTRSASSVASSINSQHRSLSYAQTHSHSRRPSSTHHSISSRNEIRDCESSHQNPEHSTDRPLSPDATPLECVVPHSPPALAHALKNDKASNNPKKQKVSSEKYIQTPFPQIRGGRLERLFFSAPEHNPHTCNVCHRRRRGADYAGGDQMASWLPSRFAVQFKAKVQESPDDDEGYAEDNEEDDRLSVDAKGKNTQGIHFANATQMQKDGARNKLPPQTVLARVLGELEEDFTHYKG
jgi:Centrosome localisation domain of PPC89